MQNRATLGKNQRLKSSKLISETLAGRKSVACYPLRLVWKAQEKEKNTVAAFFAPKKYYRHAVDRNRVKRLMREAYRTTRDQNLEGKEENYAFIFMCNSSQIPDFTTVKGCMENLFSLWQERTKKGNE